MQIDFLNPRSILCLIAILQGLVFAVMLAYRFAKKRQVADLYLAALLIVLCLSLVTPFIGFANVYDLNQWLTYFPFAIVYSYGILIWLYTVHLTDSKRRPSASDALLFLPSAAYVLFRLFLFAHDLEWKDWFGNSYGSLFEAFVFVTELTWNLVFMIFSIRRYRHYRVWLDDNFSDTEKIKFDWLRNFLYAFTAILLLGAAFDFVNSFWARLSYIQYFYFQIVLALSTYCLAVVGYLRSQTIELNFRDEAAEEKRAPLSAPELERLLSKIETAVKTGKLYLEPQLTLNDLAREVGVNTGVLSFAINSGFGKNFNDFINELRIEEVRSRLADPSDAGLLAIAFESGFNSKATFNRAFKKFTGLTPREYQDNLK